MLPRTGLDPRRPRVEERHLPPSDVEAEPARSARETPFVPEPAAQRDPRHAQLLDLLAPLDRPRRVQVFFYQLRVQEVPAVRVGHDVADPGLGGGADERRVRVHAGGGWWCHGAEGDDEELDVFECGDES